MVKPTVYERMPSQVSERYAKTKKEINSILINSNLKNTEACMLLYQLIFENMHKYVEH